MFERRILFVVLPLILALAVILSSCQFLNDAPDDSANYQVGATVYVSERLAQELLQRGDEFPRQLGEQATIVAKRSNLISVKFEDGSELSNFDWTWFSTSPEGISPSCGFNETPWKLGKNLFLTSDLVQELNSRGENLEEVQVAEVVSICGEIISVKLLGDGSYLNGFNWQWFTDTLEFKIEPHQEPEPQLDRSKLHNG